jgi:hypothetical protein
LGFLLHYAPFGRTLSVRLVIIGTILVIVPFFALLLFKMLALLTPIFDPAACITFVDDVMQISVIPVSTLVALLRWSEIAYRVPVRTLSVVTIMTPCLIIMVKCRVHHGCHVQHHLESLHIGSNFLIVFWQVEG